ncbi:uncharacterized protein ARMOST_14710 [Armillaria ostoyae]|uniref:Uncharacterized protein n=1 Tax=Armillaria ostoyae TaxID=47428 RepID=A0A284RRA6_ARMOS|nr:uncharacterized protein ARMOST_14710 [Armillaria ostoyae]
MTPNPTTPQTIGITSALVGACLIFLLGFFVALAWRERILPFLYRHGVLITPLQRLRPQPPAPFPAHYILPYASTEQLLHEPIVETTTGLQQRTPHRTDSVDNLPPRTPPPQRNATPGPSSTRQTPTPPPSSPEPEANDQDLRARYEQFPPPAYDPTNLPPPERALLPVQPRPIMGFPTLPAGRIFIRPAANNDPWPDSDDDEAGDHRAPPAHRLPPPERFILIDSDNEDLDALDPPRSDNGIPDDVSNGSRPPSPAPRPLALTYVGREDPLNINGPDFEWNELSAIDILILGPHRVAAWELRRADVEDRYQLSREGRTPMGWYLAVERGDPIPRLGRDATIATRIYYNRNRTEFPPAPGYLLQGRRPPRTADAQLRLELALLELSARQRDEDAAGLQ